MPSIDDSSVLNFLKVRAREAPQVVFELLTDRVRRESEELTAIPHHTNVRLFERTPETLFENFLASAVDLHIDLADSSASGPSSELIVLLAVGFPPVVVRTIASLLASDNKKAEVALEVLKRAPDRFALEQVGAVRSLLDSAEQGGGRARRQLAESALRDAAQSESRQRALGSPSQEDVWQRDRAKTLANELSSEPKLRAFYTLLSEVAEASIERDRIDDLEQKSR